MNRVHSFRGNRQSLAPSNLQLRGGETATIEARESAFAPELVTCEKLSTLELEAIFQVALEWRPRASQRTRARRATQLDLQGQLSRGPGGEELVAKSEEPLAPIDLGEVFPPRPWRPLLSC